jgi:DNA-binding LytR/AlgR family response regulator
MLFVIYLAWMSPTYCNSRQNVFDAYTCDEVYTAYQTLDEIGNSLSSSFFRSHKSYLINLDKVQKVSKNSNRSYQVSFYDYERTAMMSRDKYKQYLLIV